ncbi:MAG TPA: MFS transporter [Acetobacteraceae bacterium]|nr:MFS transporter [Acetobacteraceae bacterium]
MAASAGVFAFRDRELPHYPEPVIRRRYLALVVLITVALYYALYVGGGVAPLFMRDLHVSFNYLVGQLAIGNLLGAFASLLAGMSDRFGRSRLVVWGLLVVALLTLFGQPAATDRLTFAVLGIVVGFVEGIILVATPALTRDFSPQVGRATAMGLWAMGPVLGSLLTSAVVSFTLQFLPTWRDQFRLCGVFCVAVWILAFLFLKELQPALRDQILVSDRDKVLNELRARGLDIEASLRNPWRQVLRPDIVASALGVSLLLLVYYTTVAFGVIYLSLIFHFSAARANALLNWSWSANVVALLGAGLLSDRLMVRKPFMLVGGVLAALGIWLFMAHAYGAPSFAAMAAIGSGISIFIGCAYAAWMASFTETIEAHNPALTATGLAVWGWLLRLVVTASFLAIPRVVTPVTDAGEWQGWFAICAFGALVFVALTFGMKGRWSPAAARRDAAAHEAATAAALATLQRSEAHQH